jgi:menaquinol-cytochrome c reductase iron-sulfur subunit
VSDRTPSSGQPSGPTATEAAAGLRQVEGPALEANLSPGELARRRLMSRLIVGLSGLAGAVVGVPIVAYLLSPLLRPAQNVWRDVGPVSRFPIGQTVLVDFQEPSPLPWAGQTALTAAWLRRTGETTFIAFAVNCTHLGCPVSWLPDGQLFICPCHGGVYYGDGRVAAGPPPRSLHQYDVRIQQDMVQILTQPLQLG